MRDSKQHTKASSLACIATATGALLALKSLPEFRRGIRNAVRGYWNGKLGDGSQLAFVDALMTTIEAGFPKAWKLGAAECGIKPADYTNDEKNELSSRVNGQWIFASDFAGRIVTKANGGKLGAAFAASEIWIARYDEVRNAARVMACKDKPLEWVLGVAEHCSSCVKLSGKVKRASWWQTNGILPRQPGAAYLVCGGWRCQCSLVLTAKPLSRGAMPRLP